MLGLGLGLGPTGLGLELGLEPSGLGLGPTGLGLGLSGLDYITANSTPTQHWKFVYSYSTLSRPSKKNFYKRQHALRKMSLYTIDHSTDKNQSKYSKTDTEIRFFRNTDMNLYCNMSDISSKDKATHLRKHLCQQCKKDVWYHFIWLVPILKLRSSSFLVAKRSWSAATMTYHSCSKHK